MVVGLPESVHLGVGVRVCMIYSLPGIGTCTGIQSIVCYILWQDINIYRQGRARSLLYSALCYVRMGNIFSFTYALCNMPLEVLYRPIARQSRKDSPLINSALVM